MKTAYDIDQEKAPTVPPWVRRVLQTQGNAAGPLAHSESLAVETWDGAKAVPAGPFDWVDARSVPHEALAVFGPCLTPTGRILLGDVPDEGALARAGLQLYCHRTDGTSLAVAVGYHPVEHARQLFGAGRPDWAYAVLAGMPEGYLTRPEDILFTELEKQLALLAWDQAAPATGRLERFFKAEFCFYLVTAGLPQLQQPYQCQAEFWRRVGDDAMASRILRSVQAVYPSDAVARQLAAIGSAPTAYPAESAPLEFGDAHPSVLLIADPARPDYGLDVLYDGLCRVLGDDAVTEYPWKRTLHGEPVEAGAEEYARYPCLFDRPGAPAPLEQVLAKLRANRYDFILFGDARMTLDPALVRRICDAAPDVSFVIVDQLDDPEDNRANCLAAAGRSHALAYFKRELLHAADFGARAFPLPFAYPDGLILPEPDWDERAGLFWAGHRQYGLRRLHLEALEQRHGVDLSRAVAPEQYNRAIEQALAGLSLFGVGFDTIRYWELPARGCMLLAERPPIRIPNNFADGREAVFFDDVAELLDKVAFYLAHPGEALRIARAGRDKLVAHHTGRTRARQMLARIMEIRGNGA